MGSGGLKQLAVAVVVAVVAYYTGYYVGPIYGAAAGAAAGAVAGIAAAVVVGKALGIGKVNLDSIQPIGDYATQALRNQTNNNNVVPTIYGESGNAIGNKVFSDIVSGGNAELYEILVFASHECEEYVEVFAGNELMTQGTGGDTDNWRSDSDRLLVKVYTVKGTPIQGISSFSGPSTWNTVSLSALTFQHITFLDSNVPDGISFMVVHHRFSAANYAQRKDVTARIKGKLIRPIISSTVIDPTPIYSNNPAEIILDILTSSEKFNEVDDKIDVPSFFTSKTLNDTNSFSCNLTFTAKANLSANIQEVLASNRSNIIYSQGIWKLKQDEKNKVISFNITADDIIKDTFNWSQKKARDIANKIIVSWINPNESYQTKQTMIENTDLQASDGRVYTKEVQLRGVTNEAQADIIKELILNQFRYTEDTDGNRINVTPLIVRLTTTIKNSALEVGDMGTIDFFQLPDIKKFVIMSIKTKQSGELDLTLIEYADTHYKDTGGNFII